MALLFLNIEIRYNRVMVTVDEYINSLIGQDKEICKLLRAEIDSGLSEAESKIWHAHPVWFLEGNPIVGFAKRKENIQLLFWSGQSFGEKDLESEGTFKASQKRYTKVDQIDTRALKRWLTKARDIQWDYKNIVKRKGELVKLK